MYPVSEFYKTAINKKTRVTKMTGTIVLKDKTILKITDDFLVEGGFSITNQCVSGTALQIGTVYSGQLNMAIKTDLDRNKFNGAVVSPIFNLLLPDNSFEQVPLGVFYIDSADRVGKNISIVAYDAMMTKFDNRVTTSLTGFNVLQILEFIETKRKIKISDYTKENIAVLAPTNADGALITLKPTKLASDMTYRTLLSYMSELCGGFAYINRLGEIEIKRYSKTPDKTIDDSIRNSSEFSDFDCEIGTITGKYYSKNKKKIEILTEENTVFNSEATIYELSDNPYIQREADADKRKMIYKNIQEALEGVVYTPADVSYLGDPALELGDMIEFTGYNTGGVNIYSLVHIYEFSYRKNCKIKCVGQSAVSGGIAGGGGSSGSNGGGDSGSAQMYYKKYTNATDITIGTEMIPIAVCPINIGEGDSVVVNGGVTFNVTEMGTFSVVYSLNNINDAYNPKQYVPYTGHPCHVPINFLIEDIDTNIENVLKIYIFSEDGGAGTIPAMQSLIVLSSQTIADTVPVWNGTLAFAEKINTGFKIGPVIFDYNFDGIHKEIYNPTIKNTEKITTGFQIGRVQFNYDLSTTIQEGQECETINLEKITAFSVGSIGFGFNLLTESSFKTL